MIRQEISDNTGLLVREPSPQLCSEEHYLWAAAGSRLLLINTLYEYKVFIYRAVIDTRYIHTYDYAPEQCWCSYWPIGSRLVWGQQDFVFAEPCFFRLSVRRIDGIKAEGIETMEEVISFEQARPAPGPKVFADEVQRAVRRVQAIYQPGDIVLAILTDTHCTVNGTWEDTAANLKALGSKIALDGVVHLGDFTDGMVSRAATTYYVQRMLQDMQRLHVPVMTVLGNHDANYFRQNPDIMTLAEQVSLYQSATEPYKDQHGYPYYSVTLAQLKLKLFFLSAYDNTEELRYGFDREQLQWLEKELYQQPSNYKSIVFSHDAPDAALDYWASEIRNGPELLQILEKYQQQILAFIHGHTHADAIHREYPCPIVSIGCAKCEDMPCFKPSGALTPLRALGTPSQELFDILVIRPQEDNIYFVRFGAGEDRQLQQKGEQKMKKVITYGSFDLFHEGHYRLLQRAKALGDYLIVGVTTEHYDESRGKLNVVDSLMDRIKNVEKTGFADKIIIEDHVGQKLEDIQKYHVDVFTLGSDWTGKFDYLREYCQVVYLERTKGISSTVKRTETYELLHMGVIGSGRIAGRFVEESIYVSGVNVEGNYNPHIASARRFVQEHELAFASDNLEDFFQRVNAVYIAAPHGTHYAYAKAALERGKHVLCEKPMVLSKQQAKELFALAREKNLVLMEAIKTAYAPGFVRLLSMAKSGVIGTICDVESCFTRLTDSSLRELTDAVYGGSFTEFGSYTLLPIIKLLGTHYNEVRFESFLAPNGIDIYTKAYFRYQDSIASSKTGLKVKSDGQLLISGTNGYIRVTAPWWKTTEFEVCYEDYSQNEKVYTKYLGVGLRYELSDFVSTINGYRDEGFKLTAEESVAMAGLMEKYLAYRQSECEKQQQFK